MQAGGKRLVFEAQGADRRQHRPIPRRTIAHKRRRRHDGNRRQTIPEYLPQGPRLPPIKGRNSTGLWNYRVNVLRLYAGVVHGSTNSEHKAVV